jgi:hypothetical protein
MFQKLITSQAVKIIRMAAHKWGIKFEQEISDEYFVLKMKYIFNESKKYNLNLDEMDERTVAYAYFDSSKSTTFGHKFAEDNLDSWLDCKKRWGD